MVFTRSRARQQALDDAQLVSSDVETPQPSRPAVERSGRSAKKTKRHVVKITPVATPLKQPPRVETTEETIEQLALRAFRAMKGRPGVESREHDPDPGADSEDEETQPDVMMLDSETRAEDGPGSAVKKRRPDQLATSLKPTMKETPYFRYSRKKGISHTASRGWGESEADLMRKSVITSDFEKREAAPPMYVSKYARAKARKEARQKSAGKGWYEMEAPPMTPELQNDLRLLKMRKALDPSRHYKGSDWKKLPRYFQVGKVVSGPAEFYSSRVPRRQRKQTIVDELLHNHQFRRYQKRKYAELQRKFSSGTRRKRLIKHKKHYKK